MTWWDGGQKAEDRRRRAEDGGQKTEDRRRRTEDGGQKTEDRRQVSEKTMPTEYGMSIFHFIKF